ncbi:MAG TPA: glycosyltransferase family 4 protein [Candidatus Deferrimicrobium sp.]|nr:glycosyltransferase family 4 protein [Candidatus Deferrimicrobium sp.]
MVKIPKIGLLVSEFPPTGIGGAEIATHNIAKILARRNFEVHVITRNVHVKIKNISHSLKRYETFQGYIIHRIPCSRLKIFRVVTHIFFGLIELFKINPDVIHGQMITPNGLIAVLGGKLLRKKAIVYSRGTKIYNSNVLYLRSLAQFVVTHADTVIGLSQDLTNRMRRLWPGRQIITINNGIELSHYSHEVTPDSILKLIFVGRLVNNKRVSDAIRALALIKREFQNISLTIIGSGPDEVILKNLCIKLNIQNDVQILGKIDPQKIPIYLSKADIFIFPSLWESFGLAVLEAMASSLPILAARTTAIPELVQDHENGLLHTPGNVQELTENLKTLIQNPGIRKSMGQKSRELAANYSWEKVVDRLVTVYFSK